MLEPAAWFHHCSRFRARARATAASLSASQDPPGCDAATLVTLDDHDHWKAHRVDARTGRPRTGERSLRRHTGPVKRRERPDDASRLHAHDARRANGSVNTRDDPHGARARKAHGAH